MTHEPRQRARLTYIRDSLGRIEEYTRGGRDAFLREAIIQDAVLRRLETLADAVHRLPESLKRRHPTIPWRSIYGFRNIAAHAYEQIDLVRVWEVVENYLPDLKAAIDQELTEKGFQEGRANPT
jgi:uncharacterized protein with HEPN domain